MDTININLDRGGFIHLKQKVGHYDQWMTRKFAILLSPTDPEKKITSNEALYAAVRANEDASVWVFKDMFALEPEPKTMTPEEFEHEWEGD